MGWKILGEVQTAKCDHVDEDLFSTNIPTPPELDDNGGGGDGKHLYHQKSM